MLNTLKKPKMIRYYQKLPIFETYNYFLEVCAKCKFLLSKKVILAWQQLPLKKDAYNIFLTYLDTI